MRKQKQKLDIGSRLIFAVVCFGFIFAGAFLIYNENRLAQENERLAVSGIEATATVTSKAIESCGSHERPSPCYAIKYKFAVETGAKHTGTVYPNLASEIWFDVPAGGVKILHDKVEIGDEILVKYVPDDPSVHRIQDECRDCADLGSFGDNLTYYVGIFLILIGGLLLFAIRRQLFARL